MNDTRYEEIHRYLLGEMDTAEAAAFQARMEQDPQLKEDVQLEEELQILLRYQRRQELKQMLHDTPTTAFDTSTHDSEPPTPPKSSNGGIRPPFWKYATSVTTLAAIIIAAVFIFRGLDGPSDYQELYAEYYLAYQDKVDIDRSGAADSLRGFAAYHAKDWLGALAGLDTSGRDTRTLLLHGLAGMNTDSLPLWPAARRDLERVVATNDDFYELEARWYLALMDLREGKIASCKRRLNELLEPTETSQKAKALLEELNELD
jgi:hypothetical protein